MKVLMLDPSGSTVQVTHNLANALAEQGCEVHVYTSPYWARGMERCKKKYTEHVFFSRRTQFRAYEANSGVARGFWKVARFLDHAWNMLRLVRIARDYDLVHAHILTIAAFDGPCLRLIARRTPVAYTAHELLPHDTRQVKLKSAILRLLYKVPSLFFVHNAATEEGLVRRFNVPAEKIVRIPHGSLQHLLELPISWKADSNSSRTLLFLGKIRRDKGLDTLLEAAVLLRERGIPFRLLVAGYPNINMEPFLNFVREKSVESQVEFRLGYIEETELVNLFAEATVVVLPYRNVAQSGVAIGACTMGKAIVATGIGGLREMVEEAKNGRLIAVDNPRELADAVADLLANSQLRREMEANSRTYAANQLSWRPIASTTVAAYKSVTVENRSK